MAGLTRLMTVVLVTSLAAACGPAVRDGGRATTELPVDQLGAPRPTTLRCPSRTGKGKISLAWKSGHTRIKGKCAGGVMVGTWKAWHEFGRKQWKGDVVDGKLTGTFRGYHNNGELRVKADMKAGTLHGSFKAWWPNGEVRAKGDFVNGQRAGCWKTFYRTGKKRSKGTWSRGQKVLTWLLWDKQGNRTREKLGGDAAHGKCVWML